MLTMTHRDRLSASLGPHFSVTRSYATIPPTDAAEVQKANEVKEATKEAKATDTKASTSAEKSPPTSAAGSKEVGKKKEVDLAFVDRSRIWLKNGLKHFIDELKYVFPLYKHLWPRLCCWGGGTWRSSLAARPLYCWRLQMMANDAQGTTGRVQSSWPSR